MNENLKQGMMTGLGAAIVLIFVGLAAWAIYHNPGLLIALLITAAIMACAMFIHFCLDYVDEHRKTKNDRDYYGDLADERKEQIHSLKNEIARLEFEYQALERKLS